GTGNVRTERQELTHLLVTRHHRLQLARSPLVLGRGHERHAATDGLRDVDRWIVSALGELAGQHDVTIENGTRSIDDGILLVVSFRKHGIDCAHAAPFTLSVASRLYELRQETEH